MERIKITLTNDFHNTRATLIARDGKISARAWAAAMRKLCGMSTCTCGSIRGPHTPANLGFDQRSDGSVVVCDVADQAY